MVRIILYSISSNSESCSMHKSYKVISHALLCERLLLNDILEVVHDLLVLASAR